MIGIEREWEGDDDENEDEGEEEAKAQGNESVSVSEFYCFLLAVWLFACWRATLFYSLFLLFFI